MAIENGIGARWRWIILAGALVSGPLLAQSADADIDAVQRKLDAAKKAQADREAAQRAAAAAQAKMGTLVIKADRDCALSVNGATKGRLIASQTITVEVKAGEQLIECVADDRQQVEVTQRVPAGEQVVVRLTVRPPERFEAVAEGVKDNDQNLIWAGSDNGGDINFADAQRYCAAKGSGWTLPSVTQLQGLYDATGTYTQSCGPMTCNVTSSIRLSGYYFWGAEAKDSSEAWYVALRSGTRGARYSSPVVLAFSSRALCVQRS